MAQASDTSTKPAQRAARSPRVTLGGILLSLLVLGAMAFLVGSVFFILQESRSKGLPFLAGSPLGPGLPGATDTVPGGGGALAHQNGPCISCHSSKSDGATLYLALNGTDVTDNPSAVLRAGETFELAVHVDGMAGEGGGQSGVGLQLVAPRGWTAGPGSSVPVREWSESGAGRSFWSPAWGRPGAGETWRPILAQPGAFYVDYAGSPWEVPGVSAAARDDGGEGDLDVRGGAMGADAIVSVPLNTQPGKYEVIVAAVGRNGEGRLTQTSRQVTVQVDAAVLRTGKSTKPVRFKPDHGLNRPCGSCHSQTVGKLPASHQGLPSEQCTLCHTTTISGQAAVSASPVSHDVEGLTGCLACHDQAGLRPTPADHGGRSVESCTLCHRSLESTTSSPVRVPHPVEDRANCASCHSSPLVPPVPADHERRGNEMCVLCHPKADIRPAAGAPDAPHPLEGRERCLACHEAGFLKPVPLSHAGRLESGCASCHRPIEQVAIPGRASDTPHRVEGRGDCLACHGPTGMRPAPPDHAGRAGAACSGCHRLAVDPSDPVSRTPHASEGRERCLSCHSGYLIPPLPPSHEGRPETDCASCHQGRAS